MKLSNIIERRIFVQSILAAFAFTILITGFNVLIQYQDMMNKLDNSILQIEQVQVESIGTALWNFSLAELDSQTRGLVNLPFINYVEIRDQEILFSEAGTKQETRITEKTIPIFYENDGQKKSIGTLYIQADIQEIYADLVQEVFRIFLFQGLNIFLVIMFILLLLNRNVIRHLNDAAQYFQTLDLNYPGKRLALNKKDHGDELDTMVNTFNTMQSGLINNYQSRLESERKYSVLLSNLPGMAFRCKNDEDWTMELVSSGCFALTGYQPDELLFNNPVNYASIILEEDRDMVWKTIQKGLSPEKNYEITYRIRSKDGEVRWVWEKGIGIAGENGEIVSIEGLIIDITERQQRERELESIAAISYSLRSAIKQSEMAPEILAETMNLLHAEGGTLEIIDPVTQDAIVIEASGGFSVMAGERIPANQGLNQFIRKSGSPYVDNFFKKGDLNSFAKIQGSHDSVAGVPLIAQETLIGFLWIGSKHFITETDVRALKAIADIAANSLYRAQLFEETEQRLQQLYGLQQIDDAINKNYELSFIINVVLEQSIKLLDIDRTNLFIVNGHDSIHYYEMDRDFKSKNYQIETESFEGKCAYQTVTERTRFFVNDLTAVKSEHPCLQNMIKLGYRSFYSVPLIAKNEVKGAFQAFRKEPFFPNSRWTEFLDTMAGQTAIAISDSQLFRNLQISNQKLQSAYEKTIEGWSRALDLRDNETGWHSQRVTRLTITLAKLMGVNGNKLKNIRHGALLHDIGKVGIPDKILLKPGPLDPAEWEIIRQHPEYAYRLLSPIDYLNDALDIPYCHHEKWDGSGYPRGLKGEEIPLAARIFAVVDVWDALTSERPYRKKLSDEEALTYIREQAGIHFDPNVTELFINLYQKDPQKFDFSDLNELPSTN